MSDPLEKVVMDMLVELKLLETDMKSIDDYGQPTGFCDQDAKLRERLRRYCDDTRNDARYLRHRITKWQAQQVAKVQENE